MIMNAVRYSVLVAALTLNFAAVADPIEKARFTVSGDQPLDCEGCREEWIEPLTAAFSDITSQKLTTGHIVRIELDTPGLRMAVTDRDPEGECADFADATRYDPTKTVQPLPVHLRTVEAWADIENLDIAFSGSFFKFQDQGGVRADHPCGEMIGVNLRNGHLDWPPVDRPELLHEDIDFNPEWSAYALLFNADRTADIVLVEDFTQLNQAAFGIGGSALFTEESGENPTPGSKPSGTIARLGVGILQDRHTILIVKLEGNNNKRNDKINAPGHKMSRLRTLLQNLGAVEAINLDGSGSAHIVVRDPNLGDSSRPADTEGARPIANHFGFRLEEAPVTWTSYGDVQE
jgi:hypothetical protein